MKWRNIFNLYLLFLRSTCLMMRTLTFKNHLIYFLVDWVNNKKIDSEFVARVNFFTFSKIKKKNFIDKYSGGSHYLWTAFLPFTQSCPLNCIYTSAIEKFVCKCFYELHPISLKDLSIFFSSGLF